MNELIVFISNSIANGIIGSLSYDSIKKIFGGNFNKLTSILSKDEHKEFPETLEVLLENEHIRTQLKSLQNDIKINNLFVKNSHTKITLNTSKIDKSFLNNNNCNILIK